MALQRIGEMLTADQMTYIREKCALYASGAKPVFETDEDLRAKHIEQIQVRKVEIAKSQSEVGKRFESVTFDQIEVDSRNEAAVVAAYDVVNSNGKKGLGIHGSGGVGKSMLAAAIVNKLRESGIAGVCISALTLMLKFREKFDLDGSPSELSLVRKLSSVPVLAIQDLGKEPFTAYTLQMFHAIMDARWENNLPLIVTANLDLRGIVQHYHAIPKGGDTMDPSTGPTMIDRVRDMTSAPWVQITGLSRRGVS